MNRAISRTCRILFFSLILSGSTSARQIPANQNVLIKTLLVKMSRAELIKSFGAGSLSDSSWQTEGGHQLRMLLFEPVTFEGVHTLIEAFLADDSTSKIEIYLPYIGRPTTRLKVPFERLDFVRSTQEDFDQIERTIEDELGIPTVLTGTNFEYITSGNTQSIFGVFENGETKITIVPSPK